MKSSWRRTALAIGAVMESKTTSRHFKYTILDVVYKGKGFYCYKVFDHNDSSIKEVLRYGVEQLMTQVDLINKGNLRILYGEPESWG